MDLHTYDHPHVAIATVAFKAAAIIFFIIGGLFAESFIINFVVCVIFLAIDFWTVKNVSGRFLVGHRWWHATDENGEFQWRCESLEQQELDRLSQTDAFLFWWTLYITPAVWALFGVISLIRLTFDYLLIVAVALILSISNLIGFMKCRKDAKNHIHQFATQTVANHVSTTLQSALAV
eukprot:TRINITY_DN7702_c0_g1_i1.p1 TRINITY_DN7702_c0_g1~~TRINITY_DN7702_c0_g1_i1.p1  ORF type:complete len:207 (-),score=40.83 TRINITY_DN7702_c0_g1_i1:251-784(-)